MVEVDTESHRRWLVVAAAVADAVAVAVVVPEK